MRIVLYAKRFLTPIRATRWFLIQILSDRQFTLGGSEIVITKRITIDGQLNPNVAFISGSNTSRIFLIEAGGALDLRNAGLQSGNSATSAFDAGKGSAISAKQSLLCR